MSNIYITDENDLISIANVIRENAGLEDYYLQFPEDFIYGINNISNNNNFKQCINRQIKEISRNEINNIRSYAFEHCSKLTTINLPNCSYIEYSAFRNCSNLTSVNFSNCSYIGNGAFSSCSKLTTISFPSCSYIGSSAFYGCSKLTTVDFPNCSYIGSYAFNRCSRLTTINFPNCSYIGNFAFGYCSNLSLVNFPNCSSIGSSAFIQCSKLQSAYFLTDNVPQLTSNTFINTTFNNSSYLSGIYGSIYVRQSLLTSFQTASYWSELSSRIVGLTDEEIANLSF